ncbi:hypothetical protein [Mesorhizobium sp. M1B.F.Ca.ET.045.04.1.1]|uniref:hypothetical protein n=1 Tax=Mesorhizobium sp. M1B.F.Ca.ET.045.04.1.1 TaxID=2493673 RepID=UPI001FDF9FBD|nr:hypothetical protein [Mesorhizobium sp. M1B.F.Ca.ET.045.04.1.1]
MDRPILFSGPMVRALLESRKTQTRRVITPQPDWDAEVVETKLFGLTWPIGKYGQQCGGPIALPRFAIGDRLYVREVCMAEELADGSDGVRYLADNAFLAIANTREAGDRWCDLFNYSGKRPSGRRGRKVPGMHMPRWASRLTLIVTDVRVQRLQAINEIDAWAEGVQDCGEIDGGRHISGHGKTLYANLWDHLNKDRAGGAYAWAANPWIVAVSFNVIKQNIDRVKP